MNTRKSKSPELLPMYVQHLMKLKSVKCRVSMTNNGWGYHPTDIGQHDEFGNWWVNIKPVWSYTLYYVASHRKYGTEYVQARTKREAQALIRRQWHVKTFA